VLRRAERLVRVGGPPALARAAVSGVRGGDADGPRRGPSPRGRRRHPQPPARDRQPAHPRGLEARRDGERPALPLRSGEGRARRRQDRRVSAPRLGIGLSPFASEPVADFVAIAREAEARGYHTAWVGESSGYDAISVMTLIASHTERLHVGSAVVPEMLELAGEIADGVVLNWIPPETVPASIKRLAGGARRAGRTLDGFEIASFVRTCVTDDPATAREALAREITGYAIVDAYASFFRSAGFGDEVDGVNAAWKAGDRAGAVKRISARVLDGLGVVGEEAFCRARIVE